MKALSIKNPYAQLIAQGYKTLEIRSRNTHYRGDILICASSSRVYWFNVTPKAVELDYLFETVYQNAGCAIAIATITDCRPMTKQDEQAAWCEFQEGKFAYVLENVRTINPFLVKGQLGFFNVDLPILSQLFDKEIKKVINN